MSNADEFDPSKLTLKETIGIASRLTWAQAIGSISTLLAILGGAFWLGGQFSKVELDRLNTQIKLLQDQLNSANSSLIQKEQDVKSLENGLSTNIIGFFFTTAFPAIAVRSGEIADIALALRN